MMKTLYVTDLDGTLLTPDAAVSAKTKEILAALPGLLLTVATARTPYGAMPILQGLPLNVPLILQNGSILYDSRTDSICGAECIAPEAYRAVCAAAEECGLNGFAYCLEGEKLRCCYTELSTENMRAVYEERVGIFPGSFRKIKRLEDLMLSRPVYFSVNGKKEKIDPFVERLSQISGIAFSYYRDVYRPEIWYLEVSAPGATKCNGIKKLKAMTGAERVVGFGDNRNDFSLFEACDYKIAVGNAVLELKARADLVIGSNGEDAVAKYLQSVFKE